jgi:hypothetical protein
MSISINRSKLESVPREHEAQPNANGRGLEGAAPRARELAPHMQALRDKRGGNAQSKIGPPIERPQLHVGTVSSPTSSAGKLGIGDPIERPQLHIGTVSSPTSSAGKLGIGDPIERPQLHIGTVSSPLSLGSAMPKLGAGLAISSHLGALGGALKPLAQTAATAMAGGAVSAVLGAAGSAVANAMMSRTPAAPAAPATDAESEI